MNELNIKVTAHRVLIKDDAEDETKIGSIIMPPTSAKKKLEGFETGVVVDIGATAFSFLEENEIPIKIGDRVIIKKYAGVAVTKLGGYSAEGKQPDYRIVNDEDIIGVYQ